MQEAIEQRNRRCLDRQEVAPLLKWPVTSHSQAAAFVSGGHETKEQLATGVVEWSESELVNQNQLVAQQAADDFADAVVGQAAVEGLDQVRRNDVANFDAGLDGADAAAHQGMAFARAAGPNQDEVLLGTPPFQAGESVNRRPRAERSRNVDGLH